MELATRRGVRILLVGNGHVLPALRALGHEVVATHEDHPDLALPGRPFPIRALWERLAAPPDVLLVVDPLGHQTLPYGIEDVPVPRVYWAVDVHVNFFWQRHYASLFDLVCVAQRDYVPLFEAAGVPARWLPWAADETVFTDPGRPRVHDLVFVGLVDPKTRPKRAAAVELLRRRFGLVTFGATIAERLSWPAMAEVLGTAKIVFNEAIMGDLNFRVFETLACGAMLLTERIGNGLMELFVPGEHLDVYTPETLVEQVAHYLAADDERARIAAAGAREVAARHTFTARMRELVDILAGVTRRDVGRRAAFHAGMTAHLTVVRGLADPAAATPLAAERLRTAAMEGGEAEAAIALAEILLRTDQETGALAALDVARRLRPGEPRAWFLAAEIEEGRGRHEEAAALLGGGVHAAPGIEPETRARALRAIATGPRASACLHALGAILQETGRPFLAGLITQVGPDLARTAFDYYTRAYEADRSNRAAAEAAAALLEFMHLPDFATQFREAVVCIAPTDAAAREDLCRILLISYRDAAAAHHRRVLAAIAGAPTLDGTPEERAVAFHEAGVGLLHDGAVAPAIACLDRARACLPGNPDLEAEAALARIQAGQYTEARLRLEEALRGATAGQQRIEELIALVAAVESRAGRATS